MAIRVKSFEKLQFYAAFLSIACECYMCRWFWYWDFYRHRTGISGILNDIFTYLLLFMCWDFLCAGPGLDVVLRTV